MAKRKRPTPTDVADQDLPVDRRRAEGKGLRDAVPRSSHGGWKPPADRADPVAILTEANRWRLPALVPIRFGRMLASPFAFFRGGAAIMVADLASTPVSGLRVQACGDAHLMNFGGFATPERNVVFDINDLDETLPAFWEWDVKRLAASVVIAGQHLRLPDSDCATAAAETAREYRKRMADYAAMRALRVWYDSIDLDRFRLRDMAIKVVGVGSVGTRCAIALFTAAEDDALFLQIKEARASVLEPYAGKSLHANHGERVVVGQRLMQAAADIFLGWTRGEDGNHYYIRQLRDAKFSAIIEGMSAKRLTTYGRLCAWALARAHARSGDAARIAGYMGSGSVFDDVICEFAVEYADQNRSDYRAFVKAVREQRIEVVTNL